MIPVKVIIDDRQLVAVVNKMKRGMGPVIKQSFEEVEDAIENAILNKWFVTSERMFEHEYPNEYATGDFTESIRIRSTQKGLTVSFVGRQKHTKIKYAELADIFEGGAAPHTIAPRNKSYLRFMGVEGEHIGALEVEHGGLPALGFIHKAMKEVLPLVQRTVRNNISAYLKV